MDTSLNAINAKIVETLNSVNANWTEEARGASRVAREKMGWPGLSQTWNRGSKKSPRKKATAKTAKENAMDELEALDEIRMDALENGSLDQEAWDAQRDRTNEAIRNIEDEDAQDEAWDLMRKIGQDFRGGDSDGNPDFQEQERLSMMDNTDSDLVDPGFEERFQQMMKDRYAKKDTREYSQEEINDIIDRANAISDPSRWVDESEDEDFRESPAERNEREQAEQAERDAVIDRANAISDPSRWMTEEEAAERGAREEANRQSFEEVAKPGEIENLSMLDLEEFEILADNPETKQKFADERAKRSQALRDETATDAESIASNPATLRELSVYEIAEFITESDNPATRKALTDELDRRVAETNP